MSDNRFLPYIQRCEGATREVSLNELLTLFDGLGCNNLSFLRDKYEAIPWNLYLAIMNRFSTPHANKTHFDKYYTENVNIAFGLYMQSMIKCNFIGFYDDNLSNQHYILCLVYEEIDRDLGINIYDYEEGDIIQPIEKHAVITFR